MSNWFKKIAKKKKKKKPYELKDPKMAELTLDLVSGTL